jgi:hypothetical protein
MPKSAKDLSAARRAYFSPLGSQKLARLHPTDTELEHVAQARLRLAQNPKLGYHLRFGLLYAETLYRFDVDRFGLIYRINKDVEIVSVVLVTP